MSEYLVLRAVHVVAGVIWAGAAIMMAWKFLPAAQDSGPAGGQYMGALVNKRKFPVVMMILAILVFLTGGRLFMILSGGNWGAYFSSPVGGTLGLGALLALVGFSAGMSINVPTSKKMGALMAQISAAGAPPTPEQQQQLAGFRAKIAFGGNIVAVCLALATLAMGVARAMA